MTPSPGWSSPDGGCREPRACSISVRSAARRRRLRSFRLRGPHGHGGAIHKTKLAVDHDRLTGAQTLADHRFAELRALDLDRAHLGDTVLDDEDVGALRPELDRRSRYGDRLRLDSKDHLGLHELAGPQALA